MLAEASEPIILPFLKWAGGKRWLTTAYGHLLPRDFDRYVEPFLGGAAVFFHLQPKAALLSDQNADLINLYQQIKEHWTKVHRALRRHQRNHSKKYYYTERDRQHRAAHERAAQFLYLNRTCWNGLYRVNLQGQFNVPIGTKDTVLLDTDDFASTGELLNAATLMVSDFEPILASVGRGDFVFVDPPYVTRHNFNGFAKYNETIFTWADQERLARAIFQAAARGAKFLVTNADHPSIRELYAPLIARCRNHTLRRESVLAANSVQRGPVTEFALTINYEPVE